MTETLERVGVWKRVSWEVADGLVGKAAGRGVLQKFDNQKVRQAVRQLKQVKAEIREIEGGQTGPTMATERAQRVVVMETWAGRLTTGCSEGTYKQLWPEEKLMVLLSAAGDILHKYNGLTKRMRNDFFRQLSQT